LAKGKDVFLKKKRKRGIRAYLLFRKKGGVLQSPGRVPKEGLDPGKKEISTINEKGLIENV